MGAVLPLLVLALSLERLVPLVEVALVKVDQRRSATLVEMVVLVAALVVALPGPRLVDLGFLRLAITGVRVVCKLLGEVAVALLLLERLEAPVALLALERLTASLGQPSHMLLAALVGQPLGQRLALLAQPTLVVAAGAVVVLLVVLVHLAAQASWSSSSDR